MKIAYGYKCFDRALFNSMTQSAVLEARIAVQDRARQTIRSVVKVLDDALGVTMSSVAELLSQQVGQAFFRELRVVEDPFRKPLFVSLCAGRNALIFCGVLDPVKTEAVVAPLISRLHNKARLQDVNCF